MLSFTWKSQKIGGILAHNQFISRHASSSKQSAVGTQTQLTFSFFSPVPAPVPCELFFIFLSTFLRFVVVSVLVEEAGDPSVNVCEWRRFQWHFVKLFLKKHPKSRFFIQNPQVLVVLFAIISPTPPAFWWSKDRNIELTHIEWYFRRAELNKFSFARF